MNKTQTQKGITLIALIITIVVLMVLAAVAISSIQNDGIIAHANNATHKYQEAQNNEQIFLNQYENFFNNGGNTGDDGEDPTLITVKQAQTKGVLSTTSNTEVQDEYGNKIVVPAGFKITTDADTVPEGIVIEDATYTGTIGSQFVWIPVGSVKDSTGTKTINLGRYVFNRDGTIDTSPSSTSSYKEALKGETVDNKQARDIEAFIASTDPITGNGGYYIGRYEARKNSNGDLTTISTDTVWNSVNQSTASSESREMYGDTNETKRTFSSDLINSYAWDTAIVFIQAFEDNDYSRKKSLNTGSIATTGTQGITDTTKHDKVCNIWDMASNCFEWSTETSFYLNNTWVNRGGNYYSSSYYTSSRYYSTNTFGTNSSFRPLIYVAL